MPVFACGYRACHVAIMVGSLVAAVLHLTSGALSRPTGKTCHRSTSQRARPGSCLARLRRPATARESAAESRRRLSSVGGLFAEEQTKQALEVLVGQGRRSEGGVGLHQNPSAVRASV